MVATWTPVRQWVGPKMNFSTPRNSNNLNYLEGMSNQTDFTFQIYSFRFCSFCSDDYIRMSHSEKKNHALCLTFYPCFTLLSHEARCKLF